MDSLHRSGTGPAWLSTGATVRPPEPPLGGKKLLWDRLQNVDGMGDAS
jgi:hypothetical protein